MFRLGIAQKLFPAEELMPKTMELAKKMAHGPLLVYKLTKTFIDRGWGMSLEQYYDLEALALEIVLKSEDFKEGVTAFLEKRQAHFIGK
jgi:enoyl-CoA hydratase/carnithine racemase